MSSCPGSSLILSFLDEERDGHLANGVLGQVGYAVMLLPLVSLEKLSGSNIVICCERPLQYLAPPSSWTCPDSPSARNIQPRRHTDRSSPSPVSHKSCISTFILVPKLRQLLGRKPRRHELEHLHLILRRLPIELHPRKPIKLRTHVVNDVFMPRLDRALLHVHPARVPNRLHPLRQAAEGALTVVNEAEFVGPVEDGQHLCADDLACLGDCWLREESLDFAAIVRLVHEDGFRVDDCELTAANPELWWEVEEPERLWRLMLAVSHGVRRSGHEYLPSHGS